MTALIIKLGEGIALSPFITREQIGGGELYTHTHTRKNPERFSPLSIDCNQLTPVDIQPTLSSSFSQLTISILERCRRCTHLTVILYSSSALFLFDFRSFQLPVLLLYVISFHFLFFFFFASWRTSALAAMASSRMERNAIAERSRSVTIPILVAIPSRAN